jgi:hypothetical protein
LEVTQPNQLCAELEPSQVDASDQEVPASETLDQSLHETLHQTLEHSQGPASEAFQSLLTRLLFWLMRAGAARDRGAGPAEQPAGPAH